MKTVTLDIDPEKDLNLTTTYDEALKRELRSAENYFEQFANFSISVCRIVGMWVFFTTVYTIGVVLAVFITSNIDVYDYKEIQEGLREIVKVCAFIALVVVVIRNDGRFKNVFDKNARNHMQQYNSMRDDWRSQSYTTESVLIKYGLITQEDIDALAAKKMSVSVSDDTDLESK